MPQPSQGLVAGLGLSQKGIELVPDTGVGLSFPAEMRPGVITIGDPAGLAGQLAYRVYVKPINIGVGTPTSMAFISPFEFYTKTTTWRVDTVLNVKKSIGMQGKALGTNIVSHDVNQMPLDHVDWAINSFNVDLPAAPGEVFLVPIKPVRIKDNVTGDIAIANFIFALTMDKPKPETYPAKITAGSGLSYVGDIYRDGTGRPPTNIGVPITQVGAGDNTNLPADSWGMVVVGRKKNGDKIYMSLQPTAVLQK